MQIEYLFTGEDFINFQRHFLITSSFVRKRCLTFLLITSAIFFLVIWDMKPERFIWSVLGTACWVTFLLICWQLYKHSSLKQFQPDKLPKGVLGTHRIEIDQQFLREITNVNDSRYSWKTVKAVEQTEQYIFVFVSFLCAYTIPKNFFATPLQAQEFYQLAKQYYSHIRKGS